jgi:rifampicin phosphotransferase
MTTCSVVWLDEIRDADRDNVGGKAASLGELLSADFPVPPGFVIPIQVYRDCQERLAEHIKASQNFKDTSQTNGFAQKLRSALQEQSLPPELVAELQSAYTKLTRGKKNCAVAVRSSANTEDLPNASFAGQHESYLGISHFSELVPNIQRCWASLWSDHAVSYRDQMGFEHDAAGLAVLVQAQIESDVAGVMFTMDPVSGSDRQMLISANYGLGISVVSGSVTPDSFLVSSEGQILRRELGSKEFRIQTQENRLPVAQELRQSFCLRECDISALVGMGNRIKQYYGSHQDIEWCFSEGKLYVVQSRPITAARRASEPKAIPRPSAQAGDRISWIQRMFLLRSPMLANFADHFPDPLTPMDFTTTVRAGLVGIGALFGYLGLRMLDANTLCSEGSSHETRFRPQPPRPTPKLIRLPFQLVRSLRTDVMREWKEIDLPGISSSFKSLLKPDLKAMTSEEIANRVQQGQDLFEEVSKFRFRKYFLGGLLHTAIVRVVTRMAAGRTEAERLLPKLYFGINHHTAKMNLALGKLVHAAKANPHVAAKMTLPAKECLFQLMRAPEAQEFMGRVQSFLDCYGMRFASGMVPVPSHATWAERPEVVVGLIQALLRSPDSVATEKKEQEQYQQMLEAVDRVMIQLSHGWRKLLPLQRWFLTALQRSRDSLFLREESLHEGEVGIAEERALLLELGGRFAAKRIIPKPEDIFFLRLEELKPATMGKFEPVELRSRIGTRSVQFQEWKQAAAKGENWIHMAVGLPEGKSSLPSPSTHAKHNTLTLSGIGASPGQVTGFARIVRSQEEFGCLQPGEILVCPATSPAWTPLFTVAAGVVTDVGGPLSHAAIVAREYGIPAVLGTARATSDVHDGQLLLVDGNAGTVKILASQIETGNDLHASAVALTN